MASPTAQWLRGPEVDARYGLTRATRHRLRRADPNFPRAVALPTGSERWSVEALDAYFAALGARGAP
jgi:predicted DNA-binding transcriptional regulator AlpA